MITNCIAYVQKPKKVILVTLTKHNDDRMDPSMSDAKKPEIVTEYNRTQCRVEV